MTEQEWKSNAELGAMLYYVEGIASQRKLRLFTLACCHRASHALVDDRSKSALAALERYIEGQLNQGDLVVLHALAKEASDAIEAPLYVDGAIEGNSESAAACAVFCSTDPDIAPTSQRSITTSSVGSAAFWARAALSHPVWKRTNNSEEAEAADSAEATVQADLLRDIFGNPFRPVSLEEAWLTSDVLALAHGIYDDRAFDRMPILADALQDAGCTNDDILSHCRDANQVHVRGCWVVDLVLGKA
jgi:hypothetical protein